MKNQIRTRRGFSLVELLVALSILAVVAAIIVPRFLNVREEAGDTSAAAQLAAVNNVYQQWRSLGGKTSFTGNANAAQTIQTVQFLQTTGAATVNRGIAGSPCTDTMGDFGSRTISMQPVTFNATASAMTSSTVDGFYNASAANGVAAGPVYKVGNRAYPIALNADSGFSIQPGVDITAN